MNREQYQEYLYELFHPIRTAPNTRVLDVEYAKKYIELIPQAFYTVDYFEGTEAQLALMQFLYIQNKPALLMIPEDEYFWHNGISPLYPLEDRVELWKTYLPNYSCIFILSSEKSEEEVVKEIDVYRNPKIIPLIPQTDDRSLIRSTRSRAYKGQFQTFIPSLRTMEDIVETPL